MLNRILDRLEKTLLIFSYLYFCLIILAEVVTRYIIGFSTSWGGMTARYAFILMAYIAMANVASTRDHIKVDTLLNKLTGRAQLVIYIYSDILCAILALIILYYSIVTIQSQIINGVQMVGLTLNIAYAYAILPVCWFIFILRLMQRSYRAIIMYKTTGVPVQKHEFSVGV